MQVNLCDIGHRAVAFLGTCPICDRKVAGPFDATPPVTEGHTQPFVRDLEAALRVAFGPGE